MRFAWALAILLASSGVTSGQAQGTLRVRITLLDAARTPVPVPRHALLISDNPATREPRRVITAQDGTLTVRLRPGSYTVESDRPFAFLGKAYQWTQIVEVADGETTFELNEGNADVVPLTDLPATAGGAGPDRDSAALLAKWQDSVFAVWSPTAHASGFVVDAGGLIATDRTAVGRATLVEVQLSPALKVPARVLVADPARDVAILWADPAAIAGRPPLPLACPPAPAPGLDDGQEIVALATALRRPADLVTGEVTALQPRAIETDLWVSAGGSGGPAFNDAGVVVGLTSIPPDAEPTRPSDVRVVRLVFLCEAIGAARAARAGATPPPPTQLSVEPTRPYPAGALAGSAKANAGATAPPVVSSDTFDLAWITPPMVYHAQQRADWTGGRPGRAPEAEARIGRLTEFGAWSEYFADLPPVLVVRVTPKMVEGFWKRLGREAARTQGAALPAFKDFTSDFVRMRASCGGVEVPPIHPFVIEHRLSEKDLVREGLYVFDPDALGPQCGSVSVSLWSEKSPDKAETLAVDPKVIERVWQDFAPYRATAKP